MISKEDIIQLHHFSIEKFGGSDGLRDLGLLESAAARPYQTFGGCDLYPGALEKAAAIIVLLLITHLSMAIKEQDFWPCLPYWKKKVINSQPMRNLHIALQSKYQPAKFILMKL